MMSSNEKQFAIRTNALERLRKEYLSYEQELAKERGKLDFMKNAEKSPNDIRKQEEIIAETQAVIYEVKSKLIKEKENVIKILDDVENPTVRNSEQFKRSEGVVAEIEKFIDEHILNK